jgi:hypothetical protein
MTDTRADGEAVAELIVWLREKARYGARANNAATESEKFKPEDFLYWDCAEALAFLYRQARTRLPKLYCTTCGEDDFTKSNLCRGKPCHWTADTRAETDTTNARADGVALAKQLRRVADTLDRHPAYRTPDIRLAADMLESLSRQLAEAQGEIKRLQEALSFTPAVRITTTTLGSPQSLDGLIIHHD